MKAYQAWEDLKLWLHVLQDMGGNENLTVLDVLDRMDRLEDEYE